MQVFVFNVFLIVLLGKKTRVFNAQQRQPCLAVATRANASRVVSYLSMELYPHMKYQVDQLQRAVQQQQQPNQRSNLNAQLKQAQKEIGLFGMKMVGEKSNPQFYVQEK